MNIRSRIAFYLFSKTCRTISRRFVYSLTSPNFIHRLWLWPFGDHVAVLCLHIWIFQTIRFDIRNNFCFIFRRFLLWNLGRHLSWIFVSSVVRFGPGGGRKGSEGPGGAGDPGGPEGGWTWSKIVIRRWRRWNYKSKYRFTRSRPNDPRCPFSPLGLYPSSNEPKAEINAPGASHKCRLLIGRPDWTDSVSLGKCVRSHEISSSQ